MGLSATMLRALFAAGCTPEQVIAAAEAQEEADAKITQLKQAHSNAMAAERMRRKRERDRNVVRDVTPVTQVTQVTRNPPAKEPLPPTPPIQENQPPQDTPTPIEEMGVWVAPPPPDFTDFRDSRGAGKVNGHPVKPNPPHVYDLDFETLWGTYPRHDGNKRRSETEWLRLPAEDRDKALDAALLYRATIDRERTKKGDPNRPCKFLEYFLRDRHFDTLLEQHDGQ